MTFLENALARIGLMPKPRVMAAATGIPYVSRFSQDNHLAAITLEDWLGVLPEHVAVTRENAMQVATVASARHTIATTLGRLPLYLSQKGVRADLDQDGRLEKVDGVPVAERDVVRVDSPLGHGFLHNARKTVQRAIALDLSAALAEDNPVPTVELHNETGIELTDTEREELLTNWSSSRRRRGVAYTPKGLKVIAHGQAPEQLLIDGRKLISLDIVRHANLPAWAASTAVEGGSMTYDNRSLRNWELLDLTLAAYAAAFEDRFSMNDLTPRGSRVHVDTGELLSLIHI